MTDLELARELCERLDQFIDREGEWDTKSAAEQEIAALLARVRLDEAKWWRDHWNETDWLKVCRHRITKLEQAAGGRAMTLNHMICPNCGFDFYVDSSYATCPGCQRFFYAAESQNCKQPQKIIPLDFVTVPRRKPA